MNLLIADGDRAQAELLRGLLEREGHVTQVVSESGRVSDALRSGRVEGLVLSLSLGAATVSEVEGILADLRRPNGAALRRVVVLATLDEARKAEVISFLASVSCAVCLRRPAPMFDLADQFRLASTASAPPPSGSTPGAAPRSRAWPRSSTTGPPRTRGSRTPAPTWARRSTAPTCGPSRACGPGPPAAG